MRIEVPTLQVIGSDQFYELGEAEFGMPGLSAIESAGPFAPVKQIGPFVTIHDSTFEPGFGIGHHPHRYHERLFYILEGRVDHDDALNGITGYMAHGDLARLTEGVRGMLHREWNGAPGKSTRAFILVYRPDAVPEIPVASFGALRAADRPGYADGDGETLELIGEGSPFEVSLSTFRRYLDTTLPAGGAVLEPLADDEAALLYPLAGTLSVTDARGADLATLRAEGSSLPEGPAEMGVAAGGAELHLKAGDGDTRFLRIVWAARSGR
ncbi:MAG: pirin family protein [Chloroflexota bacterium]|nr:pirin family protein [Chloroflexota bacterium]